MKNMKDSRNKVSGNTDNSAILKKPMEPTKGAKLNMKTPSMSPLESTVVDQKSEMHIAHRAIAKRAYEMWQAGESSAAEDAFRIWLQAEASLLKEQSFLLDT